MASSDVSRTLRAPGRIILNPTQDLHGGTFPYGGTEIGRASVCRLTPAGKPFAVNCEATGAPSHMLESDTRYVFACFLHGFDPDVVRLLVHGSQTEGANTRHPLLTIPGTRTPGQTLMDRAATLLYVPDDAVDNPAVARNPALILYRAVPRWDEGAEVALQRSEELGMPIAFDCLRSDNGVTARMGKLPDLTLT